MESSTSMQALGHDSTVMTAHSIDFSVDLLGKFMICVMTMSHDRGHDHLAGIVRLERSSSVDMLYN